MKKLFLGTLALLCLIACKNPNEPRFKSASSEIDVLKNGIEAYEKADWSAWIKQYSDTAKIYQNNWHKGALPKEVKEGHIELLSNLSSYGFDKEEMVMEQIIDDKGRTWVNFWGLWQGTMRANDARVEIPVHLTVEFVDGKIVKEYGFWDMSSFNNEIRLINAGASSAQNGLVEKEG